MEVYKPLFFFKNFHHIFTKQCSRWCIKQCVSENVGFLDFLRGTGDSQIHLRLLFVTFHHFSHLHLASHFAKLHRGTKITLLVYHSAHMTYVPF